MYHPPYIHIASVRLALWARCSSPQVSASIHICKIHNLTLCLKVKKASGIVYLTPASWSIVRSEKHRGDETESWFRTFWRCIRASFWYCHPCQRDFAGKTVINWHLPTTLCQKRWEPSGRITAFRYIVFYSLSDSPLTIAFIQSKRWSEIISWQVRQVVYLIKATLADNRTAQEALDFGIVDGILEKRPKSETGHSSQWFGIALS